MRRAAHEEREAEHRGTAASAAPAPARHARVAPLGGVARRARAGRRVAGGRRTSSAAGISRIQASNADGQHGGAPVIGRDQPARERRDRHRRHAHAGRDQRDGEAAVLLEPALTAAIIGAKKAPAASADQHAIGELELPAASSPGSPAPGRARAARADQHDDARAQAVAHRAPAEGADAHDQEVERHGARDAGARPAGVVGHRLQEHRQREHRADARRRS